MVNLVNLVSKYTKLGQVVDYTGSYIVNMVYMVKIEFYTNPKK